VVEPLRQKKRIDTGESFFTTVPSKKFSSRVARDNYRSRTPSIIIKKKSLLGQANPKKKMQKAPQCGEKGGGGFSRRAPNPKGEETEVQGDKDKGTFHVGSRCNGRAKSQRGTEERVNNSKKSKRSKRLTITSGAGEDWLELRGLSCVARFSQSH